jgi:hypothetical protein
MKVHPFVPIRFAGLTRRGLGTGLPAKSADCNFAVVGYCPPAVTVDPHAVHSVFSGQLAELRDHQFVNIGAEHGSRSAVGLAVCVHGRPFRMGGNGMIVPDTGIVQE